MRPYKTITFHLKKEVKEALAKKAAELNMSFNELVTEIITHNICSEHCLFSDEVVKMIESGKIEFSYIIDAKGDPIARITPISLSDPDE